MLNDYNPFDYGLLLKRAKIKQCQMRYEDAVLDANLALRILPQRLEAYYVLSDLLLGLNKLEEAFKVLEVLH